MKSVFILSEFLRKKNAVNYKFTIFAYSPNNLVTQPVQIFSMYQISRLAWN